MIELPRVRLLTDPPSLARTVEGRVVGPLWLEIAGTSGVADFPERRWSDRPVVLLAAWLPALHRLARHGETAECRFLDGPYHVTATSGDAATWRLACFEDRAGDVAAAHPAMEWHTRAAAFLASAVHAAGAVLGHCDARGWWDDDTEALRRALDASRGV